MWQRSLGSSSEKPVVFSLIVRDLVRVQVCFALTRRAQHLAALTHSKRGRRDAFFVSRCSSTLARTMRLPWQKAKRPYGAGGEDDDDVEVRLLPCVARHVRQNSWAHDASDLLSSTKLPLCASMSQAVIFRNLWKNHRLLPPHSPTKAYWDMVRRITLNAAAARVHRIRFSCEHAVPMHEGRDRIEGDTRADATARTDDVHVCPLQLDLHPDRYRTLQRE